MRLFVLSLALVAAGCAATRPAPDASSSLPALEWGSSFGMCVGYCSSQLVVAPNGTVTLTENGTRSGPIEPRVRTRALTASERATIAELAAETRIAATDTLGCPDCADGGAEYVQMDGKRITFEYGRDAGTATRLATALRAVRETFPRDE